jgi:hypothetical protein
MQGDPYQVAIGFCDGQVLLHDHPNATDASADYADALSEGFEPSELMAERKHVRQVTLIKTNEKGEVTRHIDSGVMNDDCSHRRPKT